MMVNFFKKFVSNSGHKTLLSNFIYLSVLQGLNLLLPLITFPYLVRVLGVEYFGLLSFALALITYFQIVSDYGFNATATRDVSIICGDKQKQDEIFNDVMSAKLLLVVSCFIVMLIVVFTFSIFREHWEVYLCSFITIIGQALFPLWFFQGMQKMRYVTYLNLITKIASTVAIFIFVRTKTDYILVPIITGLGYLSAGLFSVYYIKKDFNITFKLQPFDKIKLQLKKGAYIFLSEFKISLFTNTNILILGILAGNHAVGYFTSAEKLARALGNFQIPLSNALYPYLAKEISVDRAVAFKKILQITKIGAIIFSICTIGCFIFADQIILLIYGAQMHDSILLFRILLIIPLASFLDTMFGKQVLLNLGKDNLYFRVILWATVLNICINLVLTHFYQQVGTAIALNITQVSIVIGMGFYALREMNNKTHTPRIYDPAKN